MSSVSEHDSMPRVDKTASSYRSGSTFLKAKQVEHASDGDPLSPVSLLSDFCPSSLVRTMAAYPRKPREKRKAFRRSVNKLLIENIGQQALFEFVINQMRNINNVE